MLHIILLILKITGIIVLSVLVFCLLAVLSVLLVPVRYRAAFQRYDSIQGKVKFSWLLHLITFELTYEERNTVTCFRIFGIKIGPRQKNRTKRKRNARSKRKESKRSEHIQIQSEETVRQPDFSQIQRKEDQDLEDGSGKDKKNIFSRIWDFFCRLIKKIRFQIRRICDTLKKIRTKTQNILAFLGDEDTKEAWQAFRQEIRKVLHHIRPRRIKLEVRFGFENPEYTGKLLGLLYIFYGYIHQFQIQPDFEHSVLEGKAYLKGHIRALPLLLSFLRLWRNPKVRNCLDKIKEI